MKRDPLFLRVLKQIVVGGTAQKVVAARISAVAERVRVAADFQVEIVVETRPPPVVCL